MHRLIYLLLLILVCTTGCTGGAESTDPGDEVKQKTVIGHVEADSIYLVNLKDRVKMVVDSIRGADNIFYNPSLEDLLLLEYVSLRREINKVGLNQPGMSIDSESKNNLAIKLTQEKWDRIHAAINESVELNTLAERFGFKIDNDSDKIIKGSVPDWDQVLWKTEIGKVSDLVIGNAEEAYFFKVHEKGVNDDGEEWVQATVMYFQIPFTQATKILIDELSEKWNIRLTNGFYKSLMEYFSCDSDSALDTLDRYLSKTGKKDSFAHYFKAHILLMASNQAVTGENRKDIVGSLDKAIAACTDKNLKVRLIYKLASLQKEDGETENFKEQLRLIFEEYPGDYALLKNLKDDFAELGDEEYIEKVSGRLSSLEEQLKAELMRSNRKVPRKSKIREGDEGFLHEDADEILQEVDAARLFEQECFTR